MDNGINVRKSIYEAAREFRKKYPLTVAFRLKANCCSKTFGCW